tara:strand:- start:231 stop:866 length:636 start_codon:yes stop_codon:yes gene_type:complete
LAADPKVEASIVVDVFGDGGTGEATPSWVGFGQGLNQICGFPLGLKALKEDAAIAQAKQFVETVSLYVDPEGARVLCSIGLKQFRPRDEVEAPSIRLVLKDHRIIGWRTLPAAVTEIEVEVAIPVEIEQTGTETVATGHPGGFGCAMVRDPFCEPAFKDQAELWVGAGEAESPWSTAFGRFTLGMNSTGLLLTDLIPAPVALGTVAIPSTG